MSDPVLDVDEAVKSFGAVVAVDEASFELHSGECKALIGPNGAGKTTLFNCISGVYDLTKGSIHFNGEDVTNESAYSMARRGLARSYQISNLFEGFTVFENLRLAAQSNGSENFSLLKHYGSLEEPQRTADRVLERIGLEDVAGKEVSSLSHGQTRQLEIGVALATDPDVLLLDEPTSGLATENIGNVLSLIDDIRADYSILLVEHNMDVVMQIADSIMVLDRGRVIADNSPEAIRNDESVQEVYLGTDQDFLTEEP